MPGDLSLGCVLACAPVLTYGSTLRSGARRKPCRNSSLPGGVSCFPDSDAASLRSPKTCRGSGLFLDAGAELGELALEAAGEDREPAPGLGVEVFVVQVERRRVALALPLVAAPSRKNRSTQTTQLLRVDTAETRRASAASTSSGRASCRGSPRARPRRAARTASGRLRRSVCRRRAAARRSAPAR